MRLLVSGSPLTNFFILNIETGPYGPQDRSLFLSLSI